MVTTRTNRYHDANRLMKFTVVAAVLPVAALAYYNRTVNDTSPVAADSGMPDATKVMDDAGSSEAFHAAYIVFMHPRCVNCHPAGDAPLQGDDSHVHAQNAKRGPDGKGKYALKCANCHQETNLAGENMPPGNANWHLPPPEMPLVFEGRTPGELARQLKDPRHNGGKTLEQLIRHIMEDKLVLGGWDPGDGRTKPPISHAEFVRKMKEWVDKGAAVPE